MPGPRARLGKQLSVKVPDEVWEWLREQALLGDRTLAAQMRRVLVLAYDEAMLATTPSPLCGHSACRQNWIDTGSYECIEPHTAMVEVHGEQETP